MMTITIAIIGYSAMIMSARISVMSVPDLFFSPYEVV